MTFDPEQNGAILNDEYDSADYQDQGELAESDVVISNVGGIKFCAHDGITDHDTKVDEFAYSLEEGVDPKSNVVEDYLKPGEPQDGKKANV